MDTRILKGLLLVILFALNFPAHAAGDPAKGKAAFATCVACHQANGEGNQPLNSPRIGGYEAWYIARQLEMFKSGARGSDPKDIPGQQMRPMAMTLADDQAIADVAAYVETLAPPKPAATAAGDAEKGKALYGVCAACHGANGEGNKAINAPPLAGQHDWYIIRQLQYYKDGTRGTASGDTFGAQMRPMAMTLPDEQAMKDVAAYISTLP